MGTEATGPEWVYGVVTFLGLDEKVVIGCVMEKQSSGGGFCLGCHRFCLFISSELLLHDSKPLFLFDHQSLCGFYM